MRLRAHLPLLAAAFGTTTTPASAWTILTVGPAGQYHSISEAVAAADADTNLSHLFEIHVAPGTYMNDFSHVTRPMRIMVDPAHAGQQVLLEATVPLPNEKGIILAEASLEVNGLTFKGAAIASSLGGNGAGIRDQITQPGAFLMVENSTFLDNQEGILTGPNTGETITISNSKFENNGNPDPAVFQHALYVGNAGSLTVSNSLFCGQLLGHNIKSRALATTVTNSQIYNGQADPGVCGAGSSSFGIDLPNSGVATISGNQLFQGAASDNQNFIMVAYGEDGLSPGDNSLLLSDNRFISTAPHSIGVDDRTPNCVVPVQLVNNTFQNVTTPVSPPGCADPPEVPEPNTLWLLLSAIVGWAAAWRCSSRIAAMQGA
jgi:hypothetical protein